MKFYEVSDVLQNLILDKESRPFVRIEMDLLGDNNFTFISDTDIIECEINSYQEQAGGIVNVGTLLLDNSSNSYSPEIHDELVPGLNIHVWYCIGNTENAFHRFSLFVDDNGFQSMGDGFDDKTTKLALVDYSYYLKKTDEEENWTEDVMVVHAVACDKSESETSLVHCIAARAGLTANDIDCDYLPYELPFVKLTNDVWSELSLLATAYKARVECGKDSLLTFAHSPYDSDYVSETENAEITLTDDDIIFYRRYDDLEKYKNSLRMKWTHFIKVDSSELWSYADSPVWYDENLTPSYPFCCSTREIETNENYEAQYSYTGATGEIYPVVYAEEIDDLETFTENLVCENGAISVLVYNTTTYKDKALIQLKATDSDILYKATIHGKAIIEEQNFSNYLNNDQEILRCGIRVSNVTNKYFSDSLFEGIPFYERWGIDTLADLSKQKRGYFIKTNLPLFNAQAGAFVGIDLKDNCGVTEDKTVITEFMLKYKKCAAFVTSMWVSSV
jgi:hypothetical protein